jgi:hypothetical protein
MGCYLGINTLVSLVCRDHSSPLAGTHSTSAALSTQQQQQQQQQSSIRVVSCPRMLEA